MPQTHRMIDGASPATGIPGNEANLRPPARLAQAPAERARGKSDGATVTEGRHPAATDAAVGAKPTNHNLHAHHLRYKIGVSGAAETSHCNADAIEKAEQVGREIAKRGMVLITGATTGLPYWAAKGAKAEGGIVIGLSPASSKAAHVKTYRLPLDYHDLVIYTGFGYSGRNLLFTRSSDALITMCGRMGTLNEFTDAFEDDKPQGVLTGAGGTTNLLPQIIEAAHRGSGNVVYSEDPGDLIDRVLDLIERDEKKNGVKGRIL
ncbi:MAG: hypothetical protein Q7S84_03900 [bacterium]|nr:hypothetical protein [bacterium]